MRGGEGNVLEYFLEKTTLFFTEGTWMDIKMWWWKVWMCGYGGGGSGSVCGGWGVW